ncbi:MAG: hypothetical protein MAG715_01003 [Methanonatronarchaeales archaeon]|nr:hypothetical protein [Methanonatronarchaeales archaeon]
MLDRVHVVMEFYASEELRDDRERGEEVYGKFLEEMEADHPSKSWLSTSTRGKSSASPRGTSRKSAAGSRAARRRDTA